MRKEYRNLRELGEVVFQEVSYKIHIMLGHLQMKKEHAKAMTNVFFCLSVCGFLITQKIVK